MASKYSPDVVPGTGQFALLSENLPSRRKINQEPEA